MTVWTVLQNDAQQEEDIEEIAQEEKRKKILTLELP